MEKTNASDPLFDLFFVIVVIYIVWGIVLLIIGAVMFNSVVSGELDDINKTITSKEIGIVPDVYLLSKGYSLEVQSDKRFLEKNGDQTYYGKWEQKKNVLQLIYDNGSSRELCIVLSSEKLFAMSKNCSCEPASYKRCANGFYIRKGAFYDLLINN